MLILFYFVIYVFRDDALLSIISRKNEMDMEEKACSILGLKDGHSRSFVQCESFTITTQADECATETSFRALLMPRYVTTLAETAQLCETALFAGFQQMIAAVEYMHSLNLVHMDIKGDNIFLDSQGKWFLGDFGSCKEEHKDITSFTRFFLPGIS